VTTHEVVLPLFSPMSSLPKKRYRTLVADPPWGYRDKLGGPNERGAEGHYGTMTMTELYNMPVGLWAEDDSFLWLWTTNAFMVEAHRLADVWGFQRRTIMTWVKGRIDGGRLIQQIGMGHFLRNSTEHIVFAVRGKLQPRNHDVPSAFIAPRLEHSEKPAAFYDMVERMSPGPYLDVFARKQRFRWDSFGNEAFDFREHGVWHKEEATQ
jgi:N6-adenosine-specific RNA methylase IME4